MDKTNTTMIIADNDELIDITKLKNLKLLQATKGKLIIKELPLIPEVACNMEGCLDNGTRLIQQVTNTNKWDHAFTCDKHYKEMIDHVIVSLNGRLV